MPGHAGLPDANLSLFANEFSCRDHSAVMKAVNEGAFLSSAFREQIAQVEARALLYNP